MGEREIVAGLRRCVSEEIDAGCDCPQCLELRPFVAAADTYLRETAQAGAVRRPDTDCGGEQHFCGPGCKLAPEAVAAPGDTSALTKFDYLLNAMEAAGQADVPAAHGYGDKRLALYAHIRRLEADRDRLAAALAQREGELDSIAVSSVPGGSRITGKQAFDWVLNTLVERNREVAQAYRWAAGQVRRESIRTTGKGRPMYEPFLIQCLNQIADRIERGPTPPDGER